MSGCSEGFDGSKGMLPSPVPLEHPRSREGKTSAFGDSSGSHLNWFMVITLFPLHFSPFLPHVSCFFPLTLPTIYPLN